MPQPSVVLPRDDAIFALYDGDFHFGLGALVNSLYCVGFRGIVYVGYRGALPPWAVPISAGSGFDQYDVADGCAIRFVKVGFNGHLTNHKPSFMMATIDALCPDTRRAFYFDVDIIVKSPWAFFQHWVSCGIAVCQDVNEPHMSGNHPLRKYWREIAGQVGLSCRQYDGYFNGGFVGLARENLSLLEVWRALLSQLERLGVPLENLTFRARPDPVLHPDQDMLNVALMASTFPLSPVENSGMDLAPGGYIMAHALAGQKPWRRRYICDALRGNPPNQPHKLFWQHVDFPIRLYTPSQRRWHVLSLMIAAAIGRFYGRR